MEIITSIKRENDWAVLGALSGRSVSEVIVVYSSGEVRLYNTDNQSCMLICQLPFRSDDLELQIHHHGSFTCIVQKFGLRGAVFDLSDPNFCKEISREDYHSQHCIYPIGFYSRDSETYLIHATEWNRLDIVCLNSDELLTPRVVDYETKSNYFDYFHSSISVSPDHRRFASNGWFWGPFDAITTYELEEFLKTFELSHDQLTDFDRGGYNWDRPLCWIDDTTVGIGHNRGEDDEGKTIFPSEILKYDVATQKMIERIEFDGFAVEEYGEAKGELYFDSLNRHFIGVNSRTGLLISDAMGNEILREPSFGSYQYSTRHRVFTHLDSKSQQFYIKGID